MSMAKWQEAPGLEAFILKLPDELLGMIIYQVIKSFSFPFRPLWQTRTLSYVSKRFHRITSSYLYKSLHISMHPIHLYTTNPTPTDLATYGSSTSQLHRSLLEDPALGSFCQDLEIEVLRQFQNFILDDIMRDIAPWFTAVKTLKLREVWVRELWEGWLAMTNMPNCTTLVLWGMRFAPLELVSSFDALNFTHGKFCRLETLCLERVGFLLNGISVEALQKMAGSAPFTKLVIKDSIIDCCESTFKAFIRWPKCLKELEITNDKRDWCTESEQYYYWDTGINNMESLQSILDIHRTSLTSITISALRIDYTRDLNFRNFKALEKLCLGKLMIPYRISNAENHFAPRLRIIQWIFGRESPESHEDDFERNYSALTWIYNDFPAGKDLVRLFVCKAIEQGCPLEIFQIYVSDGGSHDDSALLVRHVGARLDKVRREISQYGVKLVVSAW